MSNSVAYIEKVNNVAWLYLNRPEALNGINEELSDRVQACLKECEEDTEVRAIVLTGVGKAFCAGGDLKAIKAIASEEDGLAFVKKAGEITKAISACQKPVIAMVNGAAAGAGFNIALACDLIFAAEKAKFIQSFSAVGLIPDCGGHSLLAAAVGTYKAKELMFTGRVVSAEEGQQLGFVNQVYGADFLKQEVSRFAEELSKKASLAIYECKKLLNQAAHLTLEEVLDKEAEIQAKLMMSDDCKEGMAAFFEKRSPEFKGK